MEKREETRWLSPDESATWLSVWTMTVWLPSRLDAQLRRDAGLSLSEYHSLSQISMAPERTLRMSELAAVTNMTLSHLSRVVSRMEKAGLVRRSPDAVDGRYTLAVLTDSGYDRVVAAAPGHVEAVRSYVFDSLNEDQKEALGDAVGPIVEALVPSRIGRADRI
ncbi:MAG TPA: MarR family transcriptional regulator [Brevibacterium sp.]|nr:MarR family transcriptional regulator [Brevibacterium sp.]